MLASDHEESAFTGSQTAHCLSIDVEGFVESMLESFTVPESYIDRTRESNEIRANVEAVLELVDGLGIRATFFVLGRIAQEQPEVVRDVVSNGHEIACHSFFHKRISGQSPDEFRQDVRRAKSLLEDIAGQEVCGFRAPDFSIVSESMWELAILKEAGFKYDASLTPTDVHDVYGNPGIEKGIHLLSNGLWEFPASTFSLFGRSIPFGGGGYMRLYPVRYTRRLIRKYELDGLPCMLYMHPYELGPEIPKIQDISLYRKYRHYHNASMGSNRLARVVDGFQFDTAISILKRRGLKE
jgi:polysaccharide deacetylase family protein (PEP-CTERM system associated)